MIDALFQGRTTRQAVHLRVRWLVQFALFALAVVAACTILVAGLNYSQLPLDAPPLVESTPGQLAVWMADQSGEEAPESLLGQYAHNWARQRGEENLDLTVLLNAVRDGLAVIYWLIAALGLVGAVGLLRLMPWSRAALMVMLIGLDALLFIVPPLAGDTALPNLLRTIVAVLLVLLFSPGRVTKLLGFVVVLSALLVAWETLKAFGASVDYRIVLPRPDWTHQTYPTLAETLAALESRDLDAVMADSNDLEEMAPSFTGGAAARDYSYPSLRLLNELDTDVSILGLPVIPAFPGRLGIVVREEDAATVASIEGLIGKTVGAVAGEFAEAKYLALPRSLVLLDLSISDDLNLPHLQSMAESLLQPARRNGPVLLLRILAQAGLFTWTEALVGFGSGALLGFLLGAVFAHSRLMERGLLPYVVASQTVPILAFAPMVVIWLGANWMAVAVISAYLTFFPVTINTMRGLQSPHPTAVELMRSYAASPWTIMWKLRFPAALPYIFTALKVSATASVVGAIIGELPSGIRDGLGGAILNFNQYYISDPSKLWAAILVAASVGIVFFVIVNVVERLVLPAHLHGSE